MEDLKTLKDVIEETRIAGYTINNYYLTEKLKEPLKVGNNRLFNKKDIESLVCLHKERCGKYL